MGASDWVVVNGPGGASYDGGRVDFSALGDLPQAYHEGLLRQRQRAMMRPIIDPETGQPETRADRIMLETFRRAGGEAQSQYAQGLLPYLYGDQLGRSAMESILGGGAPGGRGGPPVGLFPRGGGAPPVGLPGGRADAGPSGGPPAPQPRLSSAGADNAGQTTINSVISEVFGESPKYQPAVERVLASYRASGSPGELTPEQAAGARQSLLKLKAQIDQQGPQRVASLENPVAVSGRSDDSGGQNAGGTTGSTAAPQNAGGGTSGAPAPSGSTPDTMPGDDSDAGGRGAPAPYGLSGGRVAEAPRVAPAGGGVGAAPRGAPYSSPVPREYSGRELDFVRDKMEESRRYDALSSYFGSLPNGGARASAFKDLAARAAKEAEDVRGWVGKDTERTPEQKNAAASGVRSPLEFENRKMTPEQKNAAASGSLSPLEYENKKFTPEQKNARDSNVLDYETRKALDIKRGDLLLARSDKQYGGILGQAVQYVQDLKPALDLTKGILADPRFYSGFLAHGVQEFQRVRAALGDRNAAVLQEAFEKINATSVLSIINNQKSQMLAAGEQSGRLFQSQVQQVEKASPELSKTPAGNIFLAHVMERLGEQSILVHRMAQEYLKTHDALDPKFDGMIAEYLTKNPIFTEAERSNPAILSSPDMPEAVLKSEKAADAWVKAMKLKPGDTFRLPNGNYKLVPGAGAQRGEL